MKETRNTLIRGTMDVLNVPNCNTLTKVAMNSGCISIEPAVRRDEHLKDNKCHYTYVGTMTFICFTPEEYKQAWHEYAKTADKLSSEYEDMRKAFSYALKVYRRRYGEIFA